MRRRTYNGKLEGNMEIKMIGQYLIHCYLYYICDQSIIPDEEFDQLCRDLLDKWDSIEHPHKHLISKDDLKAGTGYSINILQYPDIVKNIGDLILLYKAQGKDYLQEMKEAFNNGKN
jgi:NAD-dependent DNA ligase